MAPVREKAPSWWGECVTTRSGDRREAPAAHSGNIRPPKQLHTATSPFRIDIHLHHNGLPMDMPSLQRFAPPGVTVLVCFLAYSSQWLFYNIDPGPLRKGDAYLFNTLVACLLICYWRSCTTDPGRIPKDWGKKFSRDDSQDGTMTQRRWCRKCDAFKPPRAHHCKTCKRYELFTLDSTSC